MNTTRRRREDAHAEMTMLNKYAPSSHLQTESNQESVSTCKQDANATSLMAMMEYEPEGRTSRQLE